MFWTMALFFLVQCVAAAATALLFKWAMTNDEARLRETLKAMMEDRADLKRRIIDLEYDLRCAETKRDWAAPGDPRQTESVTVTARARARSHGLRRDDGDGLGLVIGGALALGVAESVASGVDAAFANDAPGGDAGGGDGGGGE